MDEFDELEEPRPFNAAEQQAIDQLKQMFKQNTEINFQTDNYFLTKFLRYCDWNVKKSYESIKNYYKIKVKNLSHYCEWKKERKFFFFHVRNFHFQRDNPQVHASKSASEYIDLLSLNTRMVLDKRDKKGRIVFVAKLGMWKYTFLRNGRLILCPISFKM